MPKVSILIPCYNVAKYLPESMDSVLRQTFQDYEVIIIDDGSRDNIGEIVKQYIADYPQVCIRYLHQENSGLSMARNLGVKHAMGDYLALLDADDKWTPEHLRKSVSVLDEFPEVGLVHANISRFTSSGQDLGVPQRREEFLSGEIFEHIFLRRADISCPTVVFRKSCIESVGPFDANLARLGCEDRELWLRIAQKFKFKYIPEVLAYYRVSPDSMSRNVEKMFAARIYVVNKFFPENFHHPLRDQALAKIHRDLGDELLVAQQYPVARQEYRKSLAYRPFQFWTWLNLLKTLLIIKKHA